MGEPDMVFTNQDTREIGPGFSKEFYDELHRFYSQGNRRSGRTYLLARVLVNTAIETGQVINILDHHAVFKNDRDINRNLSEQIRKIIYEYDRAGLSLDYREEKNAIKVSLAGNIYEATRLYHMIKNDYTPYNTKVNNYPLTPDEAFGRNRKLLII